MSGICEVVAILFAIECTGVAPEEDKVKKKKSKLTTVLRLDDSASQ